jgi:L-lactate dehydrogenase
MNGWGVSDNCFSIPVVVGRRGILRYLYPTLNNRERQDLITNAAWIKEAISTLMNWHG